MKNYTKEELYKMNAVDVYKLVLEGKHIKKFPDGFWKQPEAIENAIQCGKFLIEDILKLDEASLAESLSVKIFKDYKLNGMLNICFDSSFYEIVDLIYPGKYKPWDFNRVKANYWADINNAIEATKWLIEEKLQLNEEQLKEELCVNMFFDNRLKGMLLICFDGSPYKAVASAYPERNYMPWDFKRVPSSYWNKDTGVLAVKWLVETKLQLNEDELKEQLSQKLFKDNGLNGMLNRCFDFSPYKAISTAYPEKDYKPWEFNICPMGYWDDINNGIAAIKWLIEKKLKLSDYELRNSLSLKLFDDNNLSGMLNVCFDSSPYKAICAAYPERDYKPWEFNAVPQGYWSNINNGIKATRWLVEEKLQLNEDKLKIELSQQLFKDNGLIGMLHSCFDGSPYKAINATYPGKFKKEDFKNYKLYNL